MCGRKASSGCLSDEYTGGWKKVFCNKAKFVELSVECILGFVKYCTRKSKFDCGVASVSR